MGFKVEPLSTIFTEVSSNFERLYFFVKLPCGDRPAIAFFSKEGILHLREFEKHEDFRKNLEKVGFKFDKFGRIMIKPWEKLGR